MRTGAFIAAAANLLDGRRVTTHWAAGQDVAAGYPAASMSVRHFSRVFTSEVGQSPGRFVERVWLEAVRGDLEAGDDTLDVVAEASGWMPSWGRSMSSPLMNVARRGQRSSADSPS